MCLIYMLITNIIFEITAILFNELGSEILKLPIEFVLYSFVLCMPMCHRIMALIQPAYSNNVMFDIGKYIYVGYYIIMFITTLYNSIFAMTIRWFFLLLSIINLLYSIHKGDYNIIDENARAQYFLCFQLMSMVYCALLVIFCNFRLNLLTCLLMYTFLLFSNIIRIYVLFKLLILKNIKFCIRYIFSALMEMFAFYICYRFLPSEDLSAFKALLYEMPVRIYVDIVVLILFLSLFEIPMNKISGVINKI